MEGYNYKVAVEKIVIKMECLGLKAWQTEDVVKNFFSIPDFARERVIKEVKKKIS